MGFFTFNSSVINRKNCCESLAFSIEPINMNVISVWILVFVLTFVTYDGKSLVIYLII